VEAVGVPVGVGEVVGVGDTEGDPEGDPVGSVVGVSVVCEDAPASESFGSSSRVTAQPAREVLRRTAARRPAAVVGVRVGGMPPA
jgi:hypothetical protein